MMNFLRTPSSVDSSWKLFPGPTPRITRGKVYSDILNLLSFNLPPAAGGSSRVGRKAGRDRCLAQGSGRFFNAEILWDYFLLPD